MCHDIIAAIECNDKLFTRLEKTVAQYVLAHAREVLTLSISELAFNCGVAVSTVFRFCQCLQLSGYREFLLQLAIALEKRDSIKWASKNCDISIIDELFQKRLVLLHEMYELLCNTDFNEAIDRIEAADRIVLVGIGASLGIIINAYHRLLSISTRVFFAPEEHTQTLLTNSLTEKDVVIVFSCVRETSESASVVEVVKRSGAYLIMLAPSSASDPGALADWTFTGASHYDNLLDQLAFFESYTFIIDVLCGLYRTKCIDPIDGLPILPFKT